MDNLLEFLLKEIPSHAEDMISALNTSMEKINYARTLLSDKSIKLQNRDKLDEAIECIQANKELIKVENYLKEFLGDINVSLENRDSSLQSTDNVTQTDKEVSSEQNQDWKEIEDDDDTSDDEAEEELEDEKTDYSQYLVDKTIPYKLTEDFKNTSPYAFTFDGEKYLVDNWYEITIKVCEILYKKNSVLFRDIVGSCEIKGRKNAYLAFVNEYPARTIGVPRKLLDTNIIIEQRLSSNQHMMVVKRLLDKFRIPRTAINIYIESDRRPKHGQIPIGKYLNGDIEVNERKITFNEDTEKTMTSFEKKIGEYARDYFTIYFSNTEKKYDLKNFLNKYWCNEHLGICYPLLKEIDDTKPISEQRNYNNEYARYWIKPVLLINGKKYLLCSQWFKGFKEKFDRWIKEENIYPNTENFAINNQRKKERCLHYDFKKNQCMCTDAGNFTQICQNVKSCVYYIENKYPIHVVPKSVIKSRKCPCCDNDTQKEFVICTYQMANKEVKNSLLTYRCNECERNYIDDTLYFNYTNNKNLEELDVEFERIM